MEPTVGKSSVFMGSEKQGVCLVMKCSGGEYEVLEIILADTWCVEELSGSEQAGQHNSAFAPSLVSPSTAEIQHLYSSQQLKVLCIDSDCILNRPKFQ